MSNDRDDSTRTIADLAIAVAEAIAARGRPVPSRTIASVLVEINRRGRAIDRILRARPYYTDEAPEGEAKHRAAIASCIEDLNAMADSPGWPNGRASSVTFVVAEIDETPSRDWLPVKIVVRGRAETWYLGG